MDKLVSVIVPVYNTEMYLEQCARSILTQTYHNLELLLVDDGSTDNSGKICDALAEEDNRVRVLHKQNGGASSARNAGLDAMQGELVLFIDSDDFVHPQMLEVLTDLMEQHDTDIALAFSRGTQDRNYAEPDRTDYKVQAVTGLQALEYMYSDNSFPFFGYNPTMVISRLCKKEIFGNDLRFDENAHMAEDLTMAPYLFCRAKRVVSIDRRMYYIYHRPGSLTRSEFPVDRWRSLCKVVVPMYRNRLDYFQKDERFRSVEVRNYSIALFDLIEKYNECGDKQCRKILLPAYKDFLRRARKRKALSQKQNLIFTALGFCPKLFNLLKKLNK